MSSSQSNEDLHRNLGTFLATSSDSGGSTDTPPPDRRYKTTAPRTNPRCMHRTNGNIGETPLAELRPRWRRGVAGNDCRCPNSRGGARRWDTESDSEPEDNRSQR